MMQESGAEMARGSVGGGVNFPEWNKANAEVGAGLVDAKCEAIAGPGVW